MVMKGWLAWIGTVSAMMFALTGASAQVQTEQVTLSEKTVQGIRAELVCSCECGDEVHDLAHRNNCADYNNKLCRVASGIEKRYSGCKEIGVAK
jgi:hypothetical protein